MVDEIMNAIRETEASAEKIVEDAVSESKHIISEAETEAQTIKDGALAEEISKAEKSMNTVIDDGEAKKNRALTSINEEIAELRRVSADKEDEAINEILEALVK